MHGYYWEIPEEIQTIEDTKCLMQSFEYIHTSNWVLPDDTYYYKAGGCASLAGLLAYIMKYRLGYHDVRLVECENSEGIGHMVVYAGGAFYNGQTGCLVVNEYAFISDMSIDAYLRGTRYR